MDKIFAIIYILSVFLWIYGFYKLRKSEEMLNGICFVFVSIFAFMCYQTVVALGFKILHIVIGKFSFAVINLIVGAFIWYWILAKKQLQNYEYSKKDLFAIIVFALAVYIVSVLKFGLNLNVFDYVIPWDCSVHLQWARDVAREHTLPALYFMAVNMGLWFDSLTAFDPYNTGCTMFVRTDIVMLFICAGLFWTLIRSKLNEHYMYIMGIIFTILYIYGYPLNNMVTGTSYLGAGNSCILYLLLVMDLFANRKLEKKSFIIMLSIGLYGLSVSYIMFMPVACATVVIYLLIYLYQEKKITIQKMGVILSVILVIGIVGVAFFYVVWWDSMSSLALEGGIYRCFFANFVFYLPFVILIIQNIKSHKLSAIFLIVTVAYVLIFMFCVFGGKISGYYYYKNYYLLWTACFLCTIEILEFFKEERRFINAYMIGWSFLALLFVTKVYPHLNEYVDNIWGYGEVFGTIDTNILFDLYKANKIGIDFRVIDLDTKDIFEEVASMNEKTMGDVFFVGDFYLQKMYIALADQPDVNYALSGTQEECIERIRNGYEYVCVVKPELESVDISDYLSTLEIVYENNVGYIAKVK